jgi:hypothetical protein
MMCAMNLTSRRRNMRLVVGALLVAVLATATGCGGDDSDTVEGRTGPNTEGVLLTVLNYGRAANAKQVCPLLSTEFEKRAGGGDAAKCGTAPESEALCPCTPDGVEASSIEVEGDSATAGATRKDGTVLSFKLVREGPDWKIDSIERGV